MENWFKDMMGKTNAKAQEIFEQKTYDYALFLENQQNDGKTNIESVAPINDDLPQKINGSSSDPIK